MAGSPLNRLVEAIRRMGEEGAARFPRWDPGMWRGILDGPATALADGMEAAGREHAEAVSLLEAYLGLAREGVGLGYLYPEATGRGNFFSLAWSELIPRDLPGMTPGRAAEVLAACWNLGENLENAEPWVGSVFMHEVSEALSLDSLEETVERVSRSLFGPPGAALDPPGFKTFWVRLGAQDHSFLPGRMRFLAPSVLEVFDRSLDVDGKPRTALAVWLIDPPTVLGPSPISDLDFQEGDPRDPVWEKVNREDPRFTRMESCARNEWRAAATLVTSQYLVVAMPR